MHLFTRRAAVLLWFAGFFFLLALIIYPVSIGFTRAAGAVLVGALILGFPPLCWRYRILRWTLLVFYGCIALFAVLPGDKKNYDRAALRQEVVRAMLRYDGVKYYWGGEGFCGIDCSGLIRRGVIDGTFWYGIRTFNPWLVRKAVVFWWHDMSARDMGQGAGGAARRITTEKSIVALTDKNLSPGDFVITSNGIHALGYLGDHLWIEADPGEGKVIQVNARTTKNGWFLKPVSVMRWRFLDTPYR